MLHFEVELDRAMGKRAGATFQVVSITDESCEDRTALIEPGKQYVSLHALLVDIARAVGKDLDDVTLEEV